MKVTGLLVTFLLSLAALPAVAQQAHVNLDWDPHRNREGLAAYGAALISPEVHADRRVTFRLQAPAAQRVELSGAVVTAMDTTQSRAFTRDGNGLWTLTVGPLEPDIHGYRFVIDGLAVTDPANSYSTLTASPPSSQVVIHGEGPAWYDAREVPHGLVTRHIYHSGVTDGEREMYVYTPPAYDPQRRYPVLYLVGGSGGIAGNWIQDGRVNFIMDNLLAEGKVEPMLVVVPNNQVLHRNDPNHAELTFDLFERELREAVIPYIDSAYSTQAEARGRALSGLSMGGRHAMFIGLRAPDLFGSLGILSAGDEDPEVTLAAFLADPEANEHFDYLFIGQGGAEAVQPFFNVRVDALLQALDARDIEHEYYVGGSMGHDWSTWRHLLYYRFLPNLWRD